LVCGGRYCHRRFVGDEEMTVSIRTLMIVGVCTGLTLFGVGATIAYGLGEGLMVAGGSVLLVIVMMKMAEEDLKDG